MFAARVALLCGLIAVAAASCGTPDVKTATCTCNDKLYDFSCLKGPGGKPFSGQDPGQVYTYYLSLVDGGLPAAFGKCKFAPGEQTGNAVGQAEDDGSACYPIGQLSQQTWDIRVNTGAPGQTITIVFAGGQAGRQTTLRVTCNEKAVTPIYSPAGEIPAGSLNYELDVESYLACPDAKPKCKGGSAGVGGWIFVGLVFGVSFVYFAGGFALLHFQQGKQGHEAIPHVDFWTSLPGLVRDGGMFCINKIRGTSASGPYSKI